MTIDLSRQLEEQLHELAGKQGRDVRTLVEEALLLYLESASITDVEAADVAATQVALIAELGDVSDWDGKRA